MDIIYLILVLYFTMWFAALVGAGALIFLSYKLLKLIIKKITKIGGRHERNQRTKRLR
jgi:hypothetical protein